MSQRCPSPRPGLRQGLNFKFAAVATRWQRGLVLNPVSPDPEADVTICAIWPVSQTLLNSYDIYNIILNYSQIYR